MENNMPPEMQKMSDELWAAKKATALREMEKRNAADREAEMWALDRAVAQSAS